ncbi:MAG: 30S ribosomal protein S6 [bacterium]
MAKQDTDISVDETLEDGVSELRVYELGFHIDPELPVEEVKKAYHAVRELIEKKGTIVAEGEPEKIQLSYTISRQETAGRRDFDAAYFCWIAYEAPSSNHAEVIGAISGNTKIIRFIDLLTTKDSARHSVEIRELSRKAPERVKDEPEATFDVELDTALENVAL